MVFILESEVRKIDEKVTPRELLWHFKHDITDEEKRKEYDKQCRENLYDVITEDTKYFKSVMRTNLSEVIYTISLYTLEKKKPSEVCEFVRRFNKSATGIYGLEYDNQADVAVLDLYGNPFKMLAFSPKGYMVNKYEFNFYNMNGQGLLYSFTEDLNKDEFSKEHLKELWKLKEYQDKYYADIKADHDRYEEIKKYKDYISIERISSGYAYCVKEVKVKKNIPIQLTSNEIAKYADGWNYCFGGSINKIAENDEEIIYRVRINTD